MGAIFCHVDKISLLVQLIDAITEGNQKKAGNLPSFNNRANIKIRLRNLERSDVE